MIYKLSNNKVETINEHVLKEGMNWTNGEEEYEIDSTLASAPINSIVFIKKSYDGKTRTLKFEKVSTDKWDLLNKFNDRTSSYESDKSLKDKYIDGATWKLEKSVVESKSIKESKLPCSTKLRESKNSLKIEIPKVLLYSDKRDLEDNDGNPLTDDQLISAGFKVKGNNAYLPAGTYDAEWFRGKGSPFGFSFKMKDGNWYCFLAEPREEGSTFKIVGKKYGSLKEDVSSDNAKWDEILKSIAGKYAISETPTMSYGTRSRDLSIEPTDDAINSVVDNAKSQGFKEVDRYIDDTFRNDSYVTLIREDEDGRVGLEVIFNATKNYAYVQCGYDEDWSDYFESLKESINDSDEVLIFKRDVNLAKDADEIQLLIYELSDGVAEDNVQQAFNENESNDLETLKSAVITAIDVYLEDNEWLSESKSIKEELSYDDIQQMDTKDRHALWMKHHNTDFKNDDEFWDWAESEFPMEFIDESKSIKESYYSYESARPNTREFLDLMDRYSLDTDDILRYLISDYWSDNEVGDFLDAIKVEYDLDESLKNLDEELSDAAKSAEIILRNKFLNEPYTDSDFRKYAFDYMHKKGISSDEQYKVINHVMSSEDDKMVDLFTDLK